MIVVIVAVLVVICHWVSNAFFFISLPDLRTSGAIHLFFSSLLFSTTCMFIEAGERSFCTYVPPLAVGLLPARLGEMAMLVRLRNVEVVSFNLPPRNSEDFWGGLWGKV